MGFGLSGGFSSQDQASTGPLSVVGGGRGVSPWLIGAIVAAAVVVVLVLFKRK